MDSIGNFLTKRTLLHLIFWLTNSIMLFIFLFLLMDKEELNYQLLIGTILIVEGVLIGSVYINLYLLIPYFLKTRKFILYGFSQIINITIFSSLRYVLALQLQNDLDSFTGEILVFSLVIFFYVGLTTFLKFFKEWIDLQKIQVKLKNSEKEKLEAELNTLIGQINPHFLFNTLNTIYSYSLEKSDKAPELIIKLSDLMSYIIYECKDNEVSLKKEISFLKNYIELENFRLDNKTNIKFEEYGVLQTVKIAPLLLIPFVENAFKHGVNTSPKKAYISIMLKIEDDSVLIFNIENNFNPVADSAKSKGIGIENVKRRLDLVYKNQYSLKIEQKKDTYSVILKIKLDAY